MGRVPVALAHSTLSRPHALSISSTPCVSVLIIRFQVNHRGYNARHYDYLPSFPRYRSFYRRSQPSRLPLRKTTADECGSSAPLLLYPPIPFAADRSVLSRYDGAYVYAGNDSFVRSISANTGRWRWTFGADSAVSAPLGFDTTRRRVLVGSRRGPFTLSVPNNGTLAWLVTGLGAVTLAGVVYSPATDLVFVGSAGGRFTV